MYECVICQGINHNANFRCHFCGTIPAKYSWTGKPSNDHCKDVVIANGAIRAAQHYRARFALRTVTADYYADC